MLSMNAQRALLASLFLLAGCASPPTLGVAVFASPPSGVAPLSTTFTAAVAGASEKATYSWSFGDGSSPSTELSPSHSFASPGAYAVVLTVTDGERTAQGGVLVTVESGKPTSSAISVTAHATPTGGVAPLDVQLSAAVSGAVGDVTYSWDFGDGSPSSASASPVHTYAAGNFVALVTVSDGVGTAQGAVVVQSSTGPSTSSLAAAALASTTSGVAPLTVAFSSAVSGAAGSVTYSWNFGDGSAVDTSANPSHTYTSPGSYIALLTATDGVKSSQSGVVIEVRATQTSSNLTVTTVASPTSGPAPLGVTFSAAVSGAVGTPSFSWSFGDGQSSTVQSPTHTYASDGDFVAMVTVTDEVTSAQAVVAIHVATVPVLSSLAVNAFAAPTSGIEPLPVSFSAAVTGATGAVGYSWSFGDGSAVDTSASPTHSYGSAGTYTALLTVTDSLGQTAQSGVQVVVGTDSAPAVAASASPQAGVAPMAVQLFAQTAGGNAPLRLSWNFGDGSPTSALSNPSHTYAAAGSYAATVTVTDSDGDVAQDTVTINVATDASPSVGTLTASPNSGFAPLGVTFGCPASGGNAPLSFQWDFGDGQTSSLPFVTHTFALAGNYTATCVVTDADGDMSTGTIGVTAVQNSPPTPSLVVNGAYVDSSKAFALRGKPVLLDGSTSMSGNGGNDVGDSVVSFLWTFDALPAGSTASFATPAAGNTFFVPDQLGTYVVRLTVTDSTGLRSSSTHSVSAEWGCDIALVAGNGQSVTVGKPFAMPLAVAVTTPHGIPAADVELTWSTPSGTLAPTSASTDLQGAAASTARAGTVAATGVAITVAVTENPAMCQATFTANYVPGPVSQLQVTPPQTLDMDAVGSGTLPRISGFLSDAYGNAVSSVDTTVFVELTREQQKDGPMPSTPDSLFFLSPSVGTTLSPVGSPGNRFVEIATSAGAFSIALDSSTHEAKWYNVRVTTSGGYPAVSGWQFLASDDFEATASSESWRLEGDWAIGEVSSGPGSAHGGTMALGTNLAGNYQNIGRRAATFEAPVPIANTTELRVSFAQYYDTPASSIQCGLDFAAAGGYLDAEGNFGFQLRSAPTTVPYTSYFDCNPSEPVWGGATAAGWVATTVGPFTGPGYWPYGGGTDDGWPRLQWVFDERGPWMPPQDGWYVDDVVLEGRYHEHFTGRLLPGASSNVLLFHVGMLQNPVQPMPNGVVYGSSCSNGPSAGVPLMAILVLVDQFGNHLDNDSTTTATFKAELPGSGAPPAGNLVFSLLDFNKLFGNGGGNPFFRGELLSNPTPAEQTVRFQQGLAGLELGDNAPETLKLTVNGYASTATGTFLADSDGDNDSWTVGCGDCNDSDNGINPSASEQCGDSLDNNCNGKTDCYDGACSFPGCLGAEDCSSVGAGRLLANQGAAFDDLCQYNDNFPKLGVCGGSGFSGDERDAVYAFTAPSTRNYQVCWQSNDFAAEITMSLGTAACENFSSGFCVGTMGCVPWFMNAGEVLTIRVDSTQCDMIALMVSDN